MHFEKTLKSLAMDVWVLAAEFRQYFEKYGKVLDVVLMQDRVSGKPRGDAAPSFNDANAPRCFRVEFLVCMLFMELPSGFGFITFESADAVETVIAAYKDHNMKGKWVCMGTSLLCLV